MVRFIMQRRTENFKMKTTRNWMRRWSLKSKWLMKATLPLFTLLALLSYFVSFPISSFSFLTRDSKNNKQFREGSPYRSEWIIWGSSPLHSLFFYKFGYDNRCVALCRSPWLTCCLWLSPSREVRSFIGIFNAFRLSFNRASRGQSEALIHFYCELTSLSISNFPYFLFAFRTFSLNDGSKKY